MPHHHLISADQPDPALVERLSLQAQDVSASQLAFESRRQGKDKPPVKAHHITCLCGAVYLPGSFLTPNPSITSSSNQDANARESEQQEQPTDLPAFPLQTEICHCNPCRFSSGGVAGTFFSLIRPPPGEILQKCTAYRSTEKITRYFCASCGTKTFFHTKRDSSDTWSVASGTVEAEVEAIPGLVSSEITHHGYVGDTGDGGWAKRSLKIGGRDIKAYMQGQESAVLSSKDVLNFGKTDDTKEREYYSVPDITEVKSDSPAKGQEQPVGGEDTASTSDAKAECFMAQCHCKSTSLLVYPLATLSPSVAAGVYQEKWFRANGTKFPAKLCACRSCRLAVGFPLSAWTYVPPSLVIDAHTGEEVDFLGQRKGTDMRPNLPNLKHYDSSDEVVRSFCGQCGATVFYQHANRRDIINISIGILRAESGVLAEEWCQWDWGKDKCSCYRECIENDLLDAVSEG